MRWCPHNDERIHPHQCPECMAERADEQYERARERVGFDKPLKADFSDWTPPVEVMVGKVTEMNPDYKYLTALEGETFKVIYHNALRQVRIRIAGREVWLLYGEYYDADAKAQYVCPKCEHRWTDKISRACWVLCPECNLYSPNKPRSEGEGMR